LETFRNVKLILLVLVVNLVLVPLRLIQHLGR
jgi:hypothetical protein